jgi:type VI secretion system protein
MALRLTVVSEQREALGARASILLGNAGGSIGRARDNDWVLADPNCYLSAHHVRIESRLGSYYLHDTSTNGVFVNGGTVPIGRRNIYPLRDGDRLRLGDYQLTVSVEADADHANEASAIFPVDPQVTTPRLDSSEPDIGVHLDLQELLGTAAPLSGSVRAGNGSGQQPLVEDSGLRAFDRGGPSASPAMATRTRDELRASLNALASRPRSDNVTRLPSRAVAPEVAAAVEAFCRGAGIDAKALSPESPARVLHRAGLLLREALGGFKALALAQRELREQSRIRLEKNTKGQPDVTALQVEELLVQLLSAQQQELDAVQWVRECAGGMREHELAFMRALQASLTEFVGRLDPRTLAQTPAERLETDEHGGSGLTARFRSITDMSGGALPHLFVEALARAFAAEYLREPQKRGEP